MKEFDKNLDKDLISYMNSYKIIDEQEIYSNKTEFVPIFRVKQWLEYNKPFEEIERLNNIINSLEQEMNEELKIEMSGEDFWCGYDACLKEFLQRLKELKQEN